MRLPCFVSAVSLPNVGTCRLVLDNEGCISPASPKCAFTSSTSVGMVHGMVSRYLCGEDDLKKSGGRLSAAFLLVSSSCNILLMLDPRSTLPACPCRPMWNFLAIQADRHDFSVGEHFKQPYHVQIPTTTPLRLTRFALLICSSAHDWFHVQFHYCTRSPLLYKTSVAVRNTRCCTKRPAELRVPLIIALAIRPICRFRPVVG